MEKYSQLSEQQIKSFKKRIKHYLSPHILTTLTIEGLLLNVYVQGLRDSETARNEEVNERG